ncbi:transmembrane and coiled-coil domain protein 3-like isoform X1 [Coregonus clupeaformis]|uniref:transmembrane and coiled-coil domain protein 3-like isoform X1 n=1 Tax=Coregonus clupeaformis TaxID=59861 RepID=UPI001E1C3BA1|nr:transmembrane and coiled-coil domain protein 3-like isoform X1 [Coregonus clupeaformis]
MPSADTAVDKSLSEVERYHICGEMAERGGDGNNVLSLPVPMRRGGSESNLVTDRGEGGVGLDFTKGRLAIDSLQQKILKVTEQIKVEQTARDQNVAEYLKLVNNADKQQVARIRQVFEKKNQKSAHSIAHLQRKLEQYHRRMKEEANGAKHPSREARGEGGKEGQKDGSLRDISSASVRHPAMDKVKTIGPGVSLSPPFFFNKSREFANLIRNKFGSADNIAHMKSSMEMGAGLQAEGGAGARALSGSATTIAKAKYPSDDECSTGTSVSADSNGNPAGGSGLGSGGGTGRSDSQGRLGEVLEEVREIREAQVQLAEDMESLKSQFKRDYSFITQTLQEERYRFERLEDQLNDLTELHQHETSNLKQELASIEEKVAYQAYERARDIQEALESCQTRVSKLELQQQQQQTVQVENTDAKVLLGKCINIMLAIVTVILVCVSTAAKFTAPLLRSRVHLALTCVGLSLLAVIWKNWEHLQCALERMLLPH